MMAGGGAGYYGEACAAASPSWRASRWSRRRFRSPAGAGARRGAGALSRWWRRVQDDACRRPRADVAELVGAKLTTATAGGVTVRIRIDAVEPDPGDPANGIKPSAEVLLHSFSIENPDGSCSNLGDPGPDGRRQGFPLAGHARPDGTIALARRASSR